VGASVARRPGLLVTDGAPCAGWETVGASVARRPGLLVTDGGALRRMGEGGGFCCQAPRSPGEGRGRLAPDGRRWGLLLPGAPGPRLSLLEQRTLGAAKPALHYAARAWPSAKLSLATVANGLLSGPNRAKPSPLHVRRSCFGPSSNPANDRKTWWSRRVPPPGPVRLLRAGLSP
jgi:hypothetical protein